MRRAAPMNHPPRILIVDDNEVNRDIIVTRLEAHGYETLQAADGLEALAAVTQHRPDLVLLDVMMPLRNGYEVCQSIRENPAWDRVKVVMLSAKGRDLEVSQGLALGADAYVTKPFSTKALIAQVQELLKEAV
jgi:CheY-like chemotaxis protein